MDAKEDKKPLISVIVPIFNVEKYVRKCLDSLKAQTMKRIEVICIDDGSTDNSGRIADEYQNDRWPKFKVFHTKNRGLSAARNRGIDESKSDWLMFVDSDDWVSEDFCRVPYEAGINNSADMVIFQCYQKNGCIGSRKKAIFEPKLLSHEEAVDIGISVARNKLYRKVLFLETRYPEGYVYEDVAVTHRLIYKARKIILLQDQLYYPRIRRDSISHSAKSENDRLLMSIRRYEDLSSFGYPKDKAKSYVIGSALRCYGRGDKKECLCYGKALQILEEVKTIPSDLSIKEKNMMRLWKISRTLYRAVYRILIFGGYSN